MLAVNRPLLPGFDRLRPYLEEIDTARFYTNYGALHDRLLARLGGHFGIGAEYLALANSGTSALTALILTMAGTATPDRPLCICPSYTFVATAVAARACGFTPFLADADARSWALDPDRLERLPELRQAGAVIVVAPYGRTPDLAAWQAFAARTGVPTIIDAAACFDTIDAAMVCAGPVPVAISLHATKTFSTAEGGLIVSGDAGLVVRAVRAMNFGFYGDRQSQGPSINGKMSEYHAAVGLADLDGWAAKRHGFRAAASNYAAAAEAKGLAGRIIVDAAHANPYALFLADDAAQAAAAIEALRRLHIDSRFWYGRGLHHQPHYRDCPAEALAVTDNLTPRLLGLPFAPDLGHADIGRVVHAVAGAIGRP